MRFVVVLMLTACGPGFRQPPKVEARSAIVEAIGNAAAFEDLLRGDEPVNGGLWFESPACAAEFGQPGKISRARVPAFARCLAELKLQPSQREDMLADVVVLHYPPGFEVEARVVPESSGPHLSWIGFASRTAGAVEPTITTTALEALRIEGDRDVQIEPALATSLELVPDAKAAITWLRVCLDETGAVRSAVPFETTSVKAQSVFVAAVSTLWKFKPFTLAGQTVPVCSLVRFAYPAGSAPPDEVLPLPPPPSRSKKAPIVFSGTNSGRLMEGQRIRGRKNVSPRDDTKGEIAYRRLGRLTGRFRVCIDDTGSVELALPILSTGFADYDRDILGAIREWAYSPYLVDDQPVPVCVTVTFIYTQK